MTGLIVVDIFAVVLTVVGFHIAFRQRFVRGLVGQREKDLRSDPGADDEDAPDPLASVLRIAGVMLMAFGVTIGAFANLIAHFSAASSGGV